MKKIIFIFVLSLLLVSCDQQDSIIKTDSSKVQDNQAATQTEENFIDISTNDESKIDKSDSNINHIDQNEAKAKQNNNNENELVYQKDVSHNEAVSNNENDKSVDTSKDEKGKTDNHDNKSKEEADKTTEKIIEKETQKEKEEDSEKIEELFDDNLDTKEETAKEKDKEKDKEKGKDKEKSYDFYTLNHNGESVRFLNLGIDNYNLERTQRLIDDGNIIATVTTFDPNDNEITYFAGHTYNFNGVQTLGVGSKVIVSDEDGKGYAYKIIDMKKYPAGEVENDAPFIGGYHLIDLVGDGIGVESIAIQYCDANDVPMIFFGLPIN